jgi:large subunit ribosomal protein L24
LLLKYYEEVAVMHVKKGDTVLVISGKDAAKKKTGKVLVALPKQDKVIVEGVNIVTKHVKPRKAGDQGGRIQQEAPINVSNVLPVCSKCGKATRVGHQFLTDGSKIRVCKKCGESLDN